MRPLTRRAVLGGGLLLLATGPAVAASAAAQAGFDLSPEQEIRILARLQRLAAAA